jgi:hypothetical protein
MQRAYEMGRRDAAALLARFDDGGQPCGASYISPNFTCHVGESGGEAQAAQAKVSPGAMVAESRKAAAKMLGAARGFEPAITDALSGVAKAAGGELVGLEHRLKTEESLSRKLKDKAEKAGLSPDQVRVDDALRYTMQVGEDEYTDSIRDAVKKLEDQGIELVELENNWDKGDAYNGVNAVFNQKGVRFELQFHTPKSSEVKKAAHPLYEEFRISGTSQERRKELFDRMVAIADSAPQPKGIMDLEIGTKRYRPFTG